MAKSADAFRTISEVAEWLEVPAHVLRFWESKFTQVKPVKRAGGRRYYRPADMRLLAGIKLLLHDRGMTIKDVQKLLREKGVRHVSEIAPSFGDDADTLDSMAGGQILSFTRRDTPEDASGPAAGTEPEQEPAPAQDAAPPDGSGAGPLTDTVPEPAAGAATTPGSEQGEETAGPEAATRAEPACARPSSLPVPPADPPDDIAADPGPLSRLAALPRPLPAALARQLAEIARSLRTHDGTAT